MNVFPFKFLFLTDRPGFPKVKISKKCPVTQTRATVTKFDTFPDINLLSCYSTILHYVHEFHLQVP
jgi:hypothetical protein